jgi:O-methyltransferase
MTGFSRAHANSALLTRDGPAQQAVRLLNGFRGYQLVVAACRLKLPDLVGDEPRSVDELASITGTHAPSLRRALRGLVSWGFFRELPDGRYGTTGVSELFRSDRPGLRNMAVMLSNEGYRVWGDLVEALRTGRPVFERIYGVTRWERMAADPQDAAEFNAAMVETSTRVGREFVEAYDFGAARVVVDVAGGNGALLAAVLRAHPSMEGILFDLPAGLLGAAAVMEVAGVSGRVSLVAGSFFESVPTGADVYLLKSIIHDWDDEHAVAILKTCRAAMDGSARLVLVERVIPDGVPDEDDIGALMSDLHMMVVLGGRERSTAEYGELFAAAGLRLTRDVPVSDFHAIEAAI